MNRTCTPDAAARAAVLLIAGVCLCAAPLAHAALTTQAGSSTTAPPPGTSRAGYDLSKLCATFWDGYLAANPTTATSLGDRRFDDRLEDISPAGIAAEQHRLEWVLGRARRIKAEGLTPADRITRQLLIEQVEDQLDDLSCHFEDWNVDPLNGPQVALLNLADITVIATPTEAERYVARCRAMKVYLERNIANLSAGLAHGRVASEFGVRKTIDQLTRLEQLPAAQWPLLAPLDVPHDDWSMHQRDRYRAQVLSIIRGSIQPAFARYRQFLERAVLPKARPAEHAGLHWLAGGDSCYQKRIHVETSLDRTPAELHQLGLDEVARIRTQLSALGKKVLGTSDLEAIQKKLRTDPAMHFKTAAEVETEARQTLARARAAIPNYFGILPRADCVVKVMGMHEAPQSTIAYYREPALDGSRPGNYMINTYKPETRPRYEAEALAFHESIPGHHLQIAIAQELTGLPAFRRNLGTTAFVEGWGLYSERLADDMGLYTSDLDRIGMLSFDAWRACRLVVDTGMHSMGWSRQQAIDYMVANTVLAENNIVNEVDRYIANPGQALAYKCGQLEILRLREEARQRLGKTFDYKGFHDAVLRNGAVTLPVLRQQVEAWIASRAAQ